MEMSICLGSSCFARGLLLGSNLLYFLGPLSSSSSRYNNVIIIELKIKLSAVFKSQNTKYNIFVNHLYSILNVVKK